MWEEFAKLFASYSHFVVLVVLIDQVEQWLNLHCSWLYSGSFHDPVWNFEAIYELVCL